jgi:LmbE family N-acetylglucosaminyl deacetylase
MTTKEQESWLILDDAEERAGGHVFGADNQHVFGILDDYPDRPGSYDRVLVRVNRQFFRWCRWHVQDLVRQLKPGGTIVIYGGLFSGGIDGGPKRTLKRALREMLWRVGGGLGVSRLQLRLLSAPLRSAVRHGSLEWAAGVSDPQELRSGGFVVGFRKQVGEAAPECDPANLDQQFMHQFGSWLSASPNLPSQGPVPLRDAGELLPVVVNPKVLVLSPHPDDELIGCGGTLLALSQSGAEIHVVQMTEGMTCAALRDADEAVRRTIRWNEASSVADRFGFTGHYWSTGEAGALEDNATTAERLRNLLYTLKPTLVFVPAATDLHPEHRLAHQIFERSKEYLRGGTRILEYPVWGFLPEPNIAVDVSSRYSEILDALYLYKTAMKTEDYVSRCRVLAAFHGSRLVGAEGRQVEVFQNHSSQISIGATQLYCE